MFAPFQVRLRCQGMVLELAHVESPMLGGIMDEPTSKASTSEFGGIPGGVSAERDRARERNDIDLLFEQVSELQGRASDLEKAWYRDAKTTVPIIVSVFALLASVLIPVWQARQASKQHAQAQMEADLATFNNVVGQIVDLRKENTEAMSSSNLAVSQTESVLLNVKKVALQDQAKGLLGEPQLSSRVDPGLVRVLASELGLSGEVSEARKDLREVLGREDVKGWERAYAMAALANWEMLPPPDAEPREIADGRKQMQQAITFFAQQQGEYSREAVFSAYLSWANQELVVKDLEAARLELRNARQSLDGLNPLNPDRVFLEHSYAAETHLVDSPRPTVTGDLALEADAEGWYGTWTASVDLDASRSGPLILSWNKQTGLVEARLDLFENKALVEKYFGTGAFLDGTTLRIDWQVVLRSSTAFPTQQTLGYTVVRLNTARRLLMTTYLLGQAPINARAVRAATATD